MTSSIVPRTSLIYRRGDTFYFRRRIPSDLVRAKAYGETMEIRESLGTTDRRKAERLAHFKALELLDQWDLKRKELRRKGLGGFVRRSNQEPTGRPLSSLSPLERRAFIHRLFMRLEQSALQSGTRDPSVFDEGTKADVIENLKIDLAVMTGSSKFAPLDWEEALTRELEAEEIEVDAQADGAVAELRNLYARAFVESAKRTLSSLNGEWLPREDPFFTELAIGSAVPEMPKTVTLEKLGKEYEQHQRDIGASLATLAKVPMRLSILSDLWGANTPVSSLGRDHAAQLVDFLRKMPRNAMKRYSSKLSLSRMADLEIASEKPEFISPKTLRDHFAGISAILNFAIDEGWLSANPLSNRSLQKRLPEIEKESKAMMTLEEIGLIVNCEKFRKERNLGPRGHARFWVPLLCLLHGMRSNEACQLLVSDVKEQNGIHYLDLRPTDEEGSRVKNFKTRSSIRRIPLHEEILRIGFLPFVEEQRASGEEWLFPALTPNRLGSRADPIGKWFGRLRKEVLSYLPKKAGGKSLHSFRHSFERVLRDQGVSDSLQFALGGWVDKKPRNSSVEYGDGYGIEALKSAIDRVEYPGVDFSALYVHPGPQ